MSEIEERGRWVDLPREYNAANHFIDRHVGEGRGAKIAYIDDRGSYTYAELAARVNRAGNVLKRLGVQMEQRVLLCLNDGIDFVAFFWGAIKIGAIPVPVNTLLTPADYDFMLRDSRAKILAVSAPLLERFATVLADQPFLRHVVRCGQPAATDAAGGASVVSYEVLAATAETQLEAAPTVADDVALWLYSSGSTGRPKGVLHLHGSLVQTAALYADRVLGMREDDVVFSASKMFFAYGLGNTISFPLHSGATANPHGGAANAGSGDARAVDAPADNFLRRADALRGYPRRFGACPGGATDAVAHLHVRGRGAAGADCTPLGLTFWCRDFRRARLDRSPPYLPFESCGRHSLRQFGAAGAGLPALIARRKRKRDG